MKDMKKNVKKKNEEISRRDFINSAAAAIGAISFPYIVPSLALGLTGTVTPSNRIVMGCIGMGGQGTYNMSSFLENANVRISAVCDIEASHRNSARDIVNKKYDNRDCATYNDFRELISRKDIDVVVICTPDHWHGLISVAAAKAGKDIYCEKPLANTISEGRAICEAVCRYGRVLQTGSHERSNDSARFACELVRNGRIGKLNTIRVNMPNTDPHHAIIIDNSSAMPVMPIPEGFDYNMWLGPTPWAPYTKMRCHFWWRFILDYGGGEMTDRGAHIIDLAQLGNDTDNTGPIEIIGRGKAPPDGLYNTFMEYEFECRYDNGVRLIGASKEPRGLKFEGTDGWVFIHIHGGRLEAEPRSLLKESIGPNEIHIGRSPGHHQDFIDAVGTRRQPIAPAEVGHRTATICHLVNIAMLTQQKLKWDPENEQIINNPSANRMLTRPMRSPWHL